MVLQGHIERGMVVLDQPLALPDGTRVRVELMPAAPADFWKAISLEELAEEQGVGPAGALEELLGGWPPDEMGDGFEEALDDSRRRELEASE